MQIKAETPEKYIAQIPQEKISYFKKLRETILQNIPKEFEEQMSYRMIDYVVPKSIYPKGYHCNINLPLPFINIASQKNFIALYHMGIYADTKLLDWFVNEYSTHCKQKLDIGKAVFDLKNLKKYPLS